ncbi:cytochrome c family protein [Aurantimonas sp. HBX-1]|uniref:c-type cytochrome n=1 Tax=Aurantimonas sp. HBX-1 TaxID=2906072 RepID=UPI001F196ED6|nr:cytochrome c family protein [Aurantimonas sp. HBX-1]UIJ71417.1 cytochrome c family protein [Aurantimonas sp. HBX-1]
MDSFEANKIFGAVLGTIFVLFGGSILAEGLFHAEAPETPGFEIVVAEAPEGGEGAPAEEAAVPIAALLQTADAEAGAAQFRKCGACHTGEQGGANKVGPHLWDVVNRPIASVSDFSYSAALQEFSEGGSVVWDYDHLSYFIEDPKGHVPGTAMGFAGLKDPEDRANLIAYLRTLSENPAPLPEAPAAEAAPAEAAAEATDPAASSDPSAAAGESAQAPAVTDTDAAQPAPGAEAAPVQAADAQPQTPAEAQQAADAPAAPTAGDTSAAAEGTVAAGAESAAPTAAAPAVPPAAPAPVAPAAPAAVPEAAAPAAAVPAAEPVALAGDPAAGKSAFRKCQACHAIGEGAVNKIGPELNGIVGEAVASVEGYSFSPALTAFAAEHPTWTPELLTQWLENPRELVPGTKMVFPGVKDPEEIANIIAYLASFDEAGAPAN